MEFVFCFCGSRKKIGQLPQIIFYIADTGQRQEFQNVHGQLGLVVFLVQV